MSKLKGTANFWIQNIDSERFYLKLKETHNSHSDHREFNNSLTFWTQSLTMQIQPHKNSSES